MTGHGKFSECLMTAACTLVIRSARSVLHPDSGFGTQRQNSTHEGLRLPHLEEMSYIQKQLGHIGAVMGYRAARRYEVRSLWPWLKRCRRRPCPRSSARSTIAPWHQTGGKGGHSPRVHRRGAGRARRRERDGCCLRSDTGRDTRPCEPARRSRWWRPPSALASPQRRRPTSRTSS